MSFASSTRSIVGPLASRAYSGASIARCFSSSRISFDAELSTFKKQLDELIYYEKTPTKLKHFIYRPKHAEHVLRAELFDKDTGRPLRPARHEGPPKVSLLNRYLLNIESFEELMVAKNYIRELDQLTDYLKPIHLINFIIKSGEFEKSSYGLKTVYNLKKFDFTIELVRFIYFVRLLKFEKTGLKDFTLLETKLKAPFHKGFEADAKDPTLAMLSYANYAKIFQNEGFESVDKFKAVTQPLISDILGYQPPALPSSIETLSVGRKLSLYSSLMFEHAYAKKFQLVISDLPEDFVPADVQTLVSEKIDSFVTELDNLIYGVEGHEDYLTILDSKIKFPAVEPKEDSE